MKTTDNTVLITGGGSGIGFELAKLLSESGNTVIITGRNKDKLDKAAAQLSNVTAIAADITSQEDITHLADRLSKEFPALNGLINNAGAASIHNLANSTHAFEYAQDEMLTNYLSVVRLTETLLPLLKQQKEAVIVNVSSVLAIVPNLSIPTYSASKAALHSYTQALRLALAAETHLHVFELMPPLVDTEFSKEIGGSKGIAPKEVAATLLQALGTNQYEIRVGLTEAIYRMYLSSPEDALMAINGLQQQA